MIPVKVLQGKLFDKDGKPIEPTESGIIEIEVEGKKKRFIYDKLVSYLERNGQLLIKRYRKVPQYKKKGSVGHHRRKRIVVTDSEGLEKEFESCSKAAKELNICRTNIPHVLSGRYKQISGYKIKYAS
jgi:hypothetical protein